MTDEELAAIRHSVDDNSPIMDYRNACNRWHNDAKALLAEVNRLRGRFADERWLQGLWRQADSLSHVMAEDVRKIRNHVVAQDNVIHDLLAEAGAMLAYEQGAEEERTSIVAYIDSCVAYYVEESLPVERETADRVARAVRALLITELLPPAAARQEADRQRRRAEVCRKALEQIVSTDAHQNRPMVGYMARLAIDALKETAE